MPSPFPGMDPYLENPDEWRDFHTRFISHLADTLNHRLPDKFAAKVEERLVVLQDERDIVIDVAVVRDPTVVARANTGGSAAVADREKADAPRFLRIEPLEIRERYIKIIDRSDGRNVVTIIEILSPTNKEGQGRRKYLRKQREILRSGINLLEIDLLRAGQVTVAVPVFSFRHQAACDYIVCLSRASNRERAEYWPFTVLEPLPCILIPLQADVPDLVLDLQAVINDTYDRGSLDRLLNYAAEPVPPLPETYRVWTDTLLRVAKLRNEVTA